MGKMFKNNPYEGFMESYKNNKGGYAAAAGSLGYSLYEDLNVNDIDIIDSPELDRGSLNFSSESYRKNIAEAERIKESSKGGAVRGGWKGLQAGANTGNPYAAAAGLIIGSIGGAIGSGKKKRKAREAKDLALTQYKDYIGNYNNRLENLNEDDMNRERISAINDRYGIPNSFKSLI